MDKYGLLSFKVGNSRALANFNAYLEEWHLI